MSHDKRIVSDGAHPAAGDGGSVQSGDSHSEAPQSGTARARLLWPAVLLVGLSVLATTGVTRYRRWHLQWGATRDEAEAPMPGDNLIGPAAFKATRAITIAAPPEAVWPWLVQVGFGRAGFYSYDLLDNLGRPSATELLPEYASPTIGDLAAPMASPPDERNSFKVAQIVPPEVLEWAKSDSTWAWSLSADADGGTRLVTRLKASYRLSRFLPVTLLMMEVGDFPMMRRMLLGIRDRTEALYEFTPR